MKIYDFIESEKRFYESQHIPLISGDDYSQYQLIRAINLTRRNKYSEANLAKDDIIGDFPYDNISKYRIRLEARSTDFDFKHIEVEPVDESDEARVSAMVSTKALHKEMREIKFGKFLNKYADIRPEYGGFVAKKTKDGVHYVPWENLVTDMSDILGGILIEKHYMRPAELKKTNWDNVDEAIRTAADKKKEKDLRDGSDKKAETLARFIEVNEVHGEIPRAMLLEAQDEEFTPEDETEYVLASVIIAPMGEDENGDTVGVTLKAEEITEDEYPYKYDVRHPMTGRGLGEGIPEELMEHQRWHNFLKTETFRAIAIGGKILFYTDDGNVADTIFDAGIEHGSILRIGEGKVFNQANTMPNSVPMYQAEDEAWDRSADKNTNSFEAVMGEESKAGTPFRAQYLQNMAGTSQFEREREDMGFFIAEIVEDWILPEALKKAAADDEIYETFTKQELQLIDKVIVEQQVTDELVQMTLDGKVVSPEMVETLRQSIQQSLVQKGPKRKITGIKEFIKKAGKKVVVHTTDEQRNKAVLFESYSNAINLFDATDPARYALRAKILDQMGISEQELALYTEEAMAAAAQLQPTEPQRSSMDMTQMNKEANPLAQSI